MTTKFIISLISFAFFVSCSSQQLVNPRIQHVKYSEEINQENLDAVNALVDEDKDCLDKFLRDYQKSLYEYCKATGGGKNIGGGCAHVAYAWSLHTEVFVTGMKACDIPT